MCSFLQAVVWLYERNTKGLIVWKPCYCVYRAFRLFILYSIFCLLTSSSLSSSDNYLQRSI
jgi:hypothetical protein